jgi:hypothetical protein
LNGVRCSPPVAECQKRRKRKGGSHDFQQRNPLRPRLLTNTCRTGLLHHSSNCRARKGNRQRGQRGQATGNRNGGFCGLFTRRGLPVIKYTCLRRSYQHVPQSARLSTAS